MKRAPGTATKLSAEQIQAIESAVFAWVEPKLETQFYLLNVTYEKEAGYWYLRLYVEGKGTPIALSDCEQISRQLDEGLEQLSILSDLTYSLEVSSPGVFRPLKTQREFDFYQGQQVRIETIEPVKKAKPTGSKKNAAKKPTGPEGLLQAFDASRQVVTLQNLDNNTRFEVSLTPDQVVYLNPVLRFPEAHETTDIEL